MGEVVVLEYASLDGVVQAPGNAKEDRSGGFEHGGWTQPYFSDHRQYMTEALSSCGALLFGRRTYSIFTEYWPTVTDPADEIAKVLNSRPKYVASRELSDPAWQPATVLAGPLADSVRAVAANTQGDLMVLGSGALVRQLQAAGVVDRWEIMLHPVVVGSGSRMFGPQQDPTHLQLSGCRSTEQGLVLLTYSTAPQDRTVPDHAVSRP